MGKSECYKELWKRDPLGITSGFPHGTEQKAHTIAIEKRTLDQTKKSPRKDFGEPISHSTKSQPLLIFFLLDKTFAHTEFCFLLFCFLFDFFFFLLRCFQGERGKSNKGECIPFTSSVRDSNLRCLSVFSSLFSN